MSNVNQQQAPKADYIFKLILIGDQNVGKSSILLRFAEDKFEGDRYEATIGIDFRIKMLKIEDKNVKLQIWDTAGQEKFKSLTTSHYQGSHGCFCVYDVTSRKSFESIKVYLETAINQFNIPNENIYLLANKQDLINTELVEVKNDEGQQLAHNFNVYFCPTSAKENTNIEGSLTNMASTIIKHIRRNTQSSSQNTGDDIENQDPKIQLSKSNNQADTDFKQKQSNCKC